MINKIGFFLLILLIVPCLSFSAFATTNFTPSVQAKDGPEVVPKDGVYGEIIDKDGKTKDKITDGGYIIVTPLSKAEKSDEDIKSSLKTSYEIVKKADSLSDIVKNLDEAIQKLDPNFPVNNLVARDLFNVVTRGNIAQITEDNKLRVTYKLGVSADDVVIVAVCKGDKDWPVLEPKDVVNNGDGTVTVTFSQIGTVLIIVEGTTPTTVPAMSVGSDLKIAATVISGFMIALTTVVILFGKKRTVGMKPL